MADTFRLIYRSRMRIPEARRKAVLGNIFSVARSNNKHLDITGALLVTDGSFVQALEGDQPAVRALYGAIVRDVRHERVELLDEQFVGERVFGRWSMAQVGGDGEPDIPLLMNRTKGGIIPAASRPTTDDQDTVLAFMRDSVHEEHAR